MGGDVTYEWKYGLRVRDSFGKPGIDMHVAQPTFHLKQAEARRVSSEQSLNRLWAPLWCREG